MEAVAAKRAERQNVDQPVGDPVRNAKIAKGLETSEYERDK
jgi:hypothetical protein